MSFSVGVNNYTGEIVESIFRKVFGETGNAFIGKGLAHVREGVHSKLFIPRSTATAKLTRRVLEPTTVNASEKSSYELHDQELQVFDAMIFNDQILPQTLETYWRHLQPKGNIVFQDLPDNVKVDMIAGLLGDLAPKYEKELIYGGLSWVDNVTATDDEPIRGILKAAKMNNDDWIDATGGTYVALTSANIEAKLQDIKDSAGFRRWSDPKFAVMISEKAYMLLDTALRARTYKGIDYNEKFGFAFDGMRLIVVPSLNDNDMIATYVGTGEDSNIWLGCNTMTDSVVLDFDKVNRTGEYWFIKMLFKAGVMLKDPEHLIFYGNGISKV